MPLRFGTSRGWLAPLPLAALLLPGEALAAVPAGYTGTPYQGTPQVIPGRVELADLDEGGLNVAFFADHRRENAVAEGYSPVSGDDYRPGNLNLPNICKTNKSLEVPGIGSEDFWEDGSRYPSDDNLHEYYMGFAHTVDWVRVTVDVQQAGRYKLSSSWACANPRCGFSVWFNDGASPVDNEQRPLDGQNKTGTIEFEGTNDYHKWRAYPDMAEFELSAGVQLMTFHVEVADHLQYGFLQLDLVGGDAGGAGGGGAGGAAGSPSGAGSGAGGTPGVAGTAAQGSGGVPSSTAGNSGAAGASVAGQPVGGSAAGPSSATANDQGGCAFAPARAPSWAGLLLVALVTALGRRRAHRS